MVKESEIKRDSSMTIQHIESLTDEEVRDAVYNLIKTRYPKARFVSVRFNNLESSIKSGSISITH